MNVLFRALLPALLLLSSCAPAVTAPPAPSAARSNEELIAVLEAQELTMAGRYYKISPLTNAYSTAPNGEPLASKMELTGYARQIDNLIQTADGDYISVSFSAIVENEWYTTEQMTDMEAMLRQEPDGGLALISMQKSGEDAPLIEPLYPFDPAFFYEQGAILSFKIPDSVYDPQRHLFHPSVTAEHNTLEYYSTQENPTGHAVYIHVPITKETVTSIELLPCCDSDIAIRSSPFELWPKVRYTLANGAIIDHSSHIAYHAAKGAAPAFLWDLDVPSRLSLAPTYW